MEFKFSNVNQAFKDLVTGIHSGEIPTVKKNSRNGPVLNIPEPVIICYERPWERVLFNPVRDCNPFFHLFEALWMLAGKNDVESVAYYASNMKNYSDDGKTLNGAYGYRWRHQEVGWPKEFVNENTGEAKQFRPCIDQLKILIDHLKAYPDSRRAVLAMWNVEDDLLKIDGDNYSKDTCCNIYAKFSLREASREVFADTKKTDLGWSTYRVLDMSVHNRSNDLIWGTLGANVVHFSFLQEYMAAQLGVGIGRYYQITDDLHVYEDNWKPEEWLVVYENRTMHDPPLDYTDWFSNVVPLVDKPELFDKELPHFVDKSKTYLQYEGFDSRFFYEVAKPAALAFREHKARNYDGALRYCQQIKADDWRLACRTWIQKRMKNYVAKTSSY